MNRRRTRDPHAAEWLAAELREQADGHEPDLRRIEAKFRHLTTEGSHPVAPARPMRRARLRLVGVPLGIAAAAIAVSVAAVTFGVSRGHDTDLSGQTERPSSSRSATPEHHKLIPKVAPRPTRPAGTTSASGRPSATSTAGPLTTIGTVDRRSNRYWAQENLTITTTRPIRGLHLSLRVSGASTVRSTGSWSTIASADITTAVNRVPGGLVYDIALKPGQTLQAGTYVFGIQFDHPVNGHDFAADTYRVIAITADSSSSRLEAFGTFGS